MHPIIEGMTQVDNCAVVQERKSKRLPAVVHCYCAWIALQ